jgi:hypothetical protein
MNTAGCGARSNSSTPIVSFLTIITFLSLCDSRIQSKHLYSHITTGSFKHHFIFRAILLTFNCKTCGFQKMYIYPQMIYFVTYLNYKGVMMTLQFDCGISVTSSGHPVCQILRFNPIPVCSHYQDTTKISTDIHSLNLHCRHLYFSLFLSLLHSRCEVWVTLVFIGCITPPLHLLSHFIPNDHDLHTCESTSI